MILAPTPIAGMFELTAEVHRDARGAFARLYCPGRFAAAGLASAPTSLNLSVTTHRHTLRGLHFQRPPLAEAKLVRAVAGRVWDVAVDLRAGPGFGRWHAVTLDAGAMNAVFLPEGVAHGFLTLTADAQILYQMGRDHVPGAGLGIAWDDPDLSLPWPSVPRLLSDADRNWPRLRDITPL